jgi:hypothetical protein
MTPEEYLQLATYYDRLAETARDPRSRYQFRLLAENYMTVAKGIEILDRSAKLLKALDRSPGQSKATGIGGGGIFFANLKRTVILQRVG